MISGIIYTMSLFFIFHAPIISYAAKTSERLHPRAYASGFNNAKYKERMGIRKMPFVFTENGVAMLSSVLNSKKAIHVNIQIMRTFTKLRELMSSHKELKQKIEGPKRY